MVKQSHLLKLFCVSVLLVSGVAAQDDDTPAPSPTRRTTRAPITFTPITLEPTTAKVTTLKPTTATPTTTAAKTTVEPTTAVTTTEAPAPTTTETSAPSTTTVAPTTTTRKPTTTKPATTEAIIEETAAPATTLRSTTAPPAADSGDNTGLYIGLGVGGAVLLAGIVFLLLKLKQARDDDDDDYEEVHTYKITAPTYTKPAPTVAVLNANAPPAKAPQIVTQQYNPYSNNNSINAPSYQHQRSLQPTTSVPVVGSYLNTTSTHRDSEFEYEGQHSAVLPPVAAGGYDTDRESEFASQSFLNNPSGQHSVYEFKDSIDSRDSGLSEDLQPSPKRNGRARVSSVEL